MTHEQIIYVIMAGGIVFALLVMLAAHLEDRKNAASWRRAMEAADRRRDGKGSDA